jgi:arylsulfatase A-like enzyme
VDWLPTLADYTGVEIPNPTELDGLSLRKVISENANSPHDLMHWATGNPENSKGAWAVRKGPWKLLGNPTDPTKKLNFGEADQLYLVNLQQDSTEVKNLATKNSEVVSELLKLHMDWIEEILNRKSSN